jgi:hypothetical protein
VQNDRVCFRQITGARTVSPELIGEFVGAGVGAGAGGGLLPVAARIGRKVAHEFLGFPPIWTTLALTIFADGRSEGAVVCHSLFPSMSYYAMDVIPGVATRREVSVFELVGRPYDAVANLDRWKKDGWGSLPASPSGPCGGNPWGLTKGDLTVRPLDSDRRVV